MASNQELACAYAALILQDDEVAITGEKIATLLKAANVEFEPNCPGLFAKALEGVDVKNLITSVSSGAGSGPAPAAAAAAHYQGPVRGGEPHEFRQQLMVPAGESLNEARPAYRPGEEPPMEPMQAPGAIGPMNVRPNVANPLVVFNATNAIHRPRTG